MLLITTIGERAATWRLSESAAAERMDADERLEGGKVVSLSAFMAKLRAAKTAALDAKAAGGAPGQAAEVGGTLTLHVL